MPPDQRLAQQKKLLKLFQDAADDLKAGRNIFENPDIAKQMLAAQQVSRLRGQQGPLLRDESG